MRSVVQRISPELNGILMKGRIDFNQKNLPKGKKSKPLSITEYSDLLAKRIKELNLDSSLHLEELSSRRKGSTRFNY